MNTDNKDIIQSLEDKYWTRHQATIDPMGIDHLSYDMKADDSSKFSIHVEEDDPYAINYYQESGTNSGKYGVTVIPRHLHADNISAYLTSNGVVASVLTVDDEGTRGTPFIFADQRYNELDTYLSYFYVLGLLSSGRVELAKKIGSNITYMVGHTHDLKASNRIYHQHLPMIPVYTSMVHRIASTFDDEGSRRKWMGIHIKRAILNHERIWDQDETKHHSGLGVYPKRDYDSSTFPYSLPSSERVSSVLNILLYKTEADIAHFIAEHVEGGTLEIDGKVHTSSDWHDRANIRGKLIMDNMWNEENQNIFDITLDTGEQIVENIAHWVYGIWAGFFNTIRSQNILNFHHKSEMIKDGLLHYNGDILYPHHQMLYWEATTSLGQLELAKYATDKWATLVLSSDKVRLGRAYSAQGGIVESDGESNAVTLASLAHIKEYA